MSLKSPWLNRPARDDLPTAMSPMSTIFASINSGSELCSALRLPLSGLSDLTFNYLLEGTDSFFRFDPPQQELDFYLSIYYFKLLEII